MATKVKPWRKEDRKVVQQAIASGQPCQDCDCCGGSLPPSEAWEELRATGRGPDCDGSVDRNGNCRAFADVM